MREAAAAAMRSPRKGSPVRRVAASTAPDYGPLTTGLVQNLMVQFLSYIYIALGISALSVCYARLGENNSG